ncbi:TM2 domain-containing protein [Mesorhizobium sp. C416B]|uniref:TM2 domain-containing protein n=1 Tax=unclassified Mesorhizobium TaxID=325217 RepID=UPI0003CF7976|nr:MULTISPECIES: TM2 domain-containing protein [unclassified Mesorhizobium]ESX46608.1 membrane protein [Mesorhizobium sp. LSHC426A00]ESX54308.1 membrane protein [Mesorhizobium sp. LSHC424B00]ESX72243.1 membrane protein [Mesorhizobium sp. LSHC416B00]WJI64493.1 TM2 domain-containing protein [Mesorhizobium sp. C416B]
MKSGVVAFVLWCGGFFLVCGLHRFYTGRTGSGILWLLTFGLLGIGQIVDLFMLGSMVRQANMMRGLAGASAYVHNNNVVAPVINITVDPRYAGPPSSNQITPS